MTGPERPRRRAARLPITLGDDERRTIDEVTRVHVLAVLKACHNNRTDAAHILGVDRKTLSRSLQRWGITAPAESRGLGPGSLVAIEGVDGAGLTTQARLLVEYLNARGHSAMQTAEPSDGPMGQLLRQLLASESALPEAGAMRSLGLLFASDRVDHFHRVVAPALARGVTVVTDRWYHSSLAYQRSGVERDWIRTLNRHTRTPDVTVLLEVRPEIGDRRRTAARRRREFFHDEATQRDIAGGYKATIAELRIEGERIDVVDGEQPQAAVALAIRRTLGI